MDTSMEADPFADLNETTVIQFEESFARNFMYYFWVFSEILKFFLCIAVIIIDILLIIAIAKTEKLRKSRMNKYILFYAIANLMYMIAEPIIYLFLASIVSIPSAVTFCFVSQFDHSIFMLCFLLGLCPGIEWYLTYYKSNIHQKLKEHYLKIIFISFSSVFFLHLLINQGVCFMESYMIQQYFILATYIFAAVLIVVLNVLKYRNISTKESERTNYYMHISTYVVGCWIPCFLFHVFYMFNNEWNMFWRIVVELNYIAEYFAYSAMIFVLMVLLRRNKYYRMAFDTMFKKSKVQNYQSDDLDNDDDNDLETGSESSINQENPGP